MTGNSETDHEGSSLPSQTGQQQEILTEVSGSDGSTDVSTLGSQTSHMSAEESLRRMEMNLTIREKKRKIEELYSNGRWMDQCEHEITKVKTIVRNDIFANVKFVKGEGQAGVAVAKGRKNKAVFKKLGETNERVDLTEKRGYWTELLEKCGYGESEKSLTTRTMYWKSYHDVVKEQIGDLRSKKNNSMKQIIRQGKNFSS